MENRPKKYIQIVCPVCGRVIPVRLLEVEGRLKYSLKCKNCKQESEVVIQEPLRTDITDIG